MSSASEPALVAVRDLTMAFGPRVLQRDLTFEVRQGHVFVVMGGSGTGKSTLLRHMVGLVEPAAGDVRYGEASLFTGDAAERATLRRRIGVMYQQGALWSSMTLLENVLLPLDQRDDLPAATRRDVARLKLALVGLGGFETFYPSEISGGMRKRAAIARAMALDPEILYLDEPSAGLDPISARRLDDLILELRDALGTTFVMVTHELASIFAVGDDSVFLDADSRTMIARGNPKELVAHSDDARVRRFLTRGEEAA
jgi:phospholipid/cholesterol/gamma-HCH transport system ATP-binding protein